jgi:hypothetical protein
LPKFDRLTRAQTLTGLVGLIPHDKWEESTTFLMERLINGDVEKGWLADQMLILYRRHLNVLYGLQQDYSITEQIVLFFCEHGFFRTKELTESDRSMLREKLFSLLSVLIRDSTEVWSSNAILYIEKLEENKRKKVIKLDSEIKKIRKYGLKTMRKLRLKVHKLKEGD